MVDRSNASAFAVAKEVTSGTFVAPTSANVIQIADIKCQIDGITVDINEYTGSIHKVGPTVLGKSLTVSGKLYLRGPGGTSTPAADAWLPGLILQAGGLAETVTSAAIPVSPEAVASGTTTTATLGASATGTLDLYKGMMIKFATGLSGSGNKLYTMIRAYTAAKIATLAETAGGSISGNYQLPKQLSYRTSTSSTIPTLSTSVWMGNYRIDGVGMAISALKFVMPTTGRNASEPPYVEFTLTGDVQDDADETCPVITAGLAIPPYRDGKLWVGNTQMGGTSFDIDFNAQVAYPPNPNNASGNETALLTGTTRKVALNLNQYSKATKDFLALADAQATHSVMALWGSATGNMFGVIVTDGRFNFRSPDNSAEYVTSTGEMFVDGANKDVSIVIPFF